jgi:hypothetical protein
VDAAGAGGPVEGVESVIGAIRPTAGPPPREWFSAEITAAPNAVPARRVNRISRAMGIAYRPEADSGERADCGRTDKLESRDPECP